MSTLSHQTPEAPWKISRYLRFSFIQHEITQFLLLPLFVSNHGGDGLHLEAIPQAVVRMDDKENYEEIARQRHHHSGFNFSGFSNDFLGCF